MIKLKQLAYLFCLCAVLTITQSCEKAKYNNRWTQKGANILGENSLERSGWTTSLSSDGNTIAIGASGLI